MLLPLMDSSQSNEVLISRLALATDKGVATVEHANQVDSHSWELRFSQFPIRRSDILQPPFMTMNTSIRSNNINPSVPLKRELEQLENRSPRRNIRLHKRRFSTAITPKVKGDTYPSTFCSTDFPPVTFVSANTTLAPA